MGSTELVNIESALTGSLLEEGINMLAGALGILGGMGPLATADFLSKLTVATPANCDQVHIPVLVYGDCSTPDRTASILGVGPSPLPKLLAGIEFLNRSGCAVIAVPCNSAHCWYEDMQRASQIPVLHIVESSAHKVRLNCAATRRVGVLSTEGTHRTGIYRSSLERLAFEVIEPTAQEFKEWVSPAIADIKAGRMAEAEFKFDLAADHLLLRGAEQIILGCTEIPLGMRARCRAQQMGVVDSTQALVDAVLRHFSRTP